MGHSQVFNPHKISFWWFEWNTDQKDIYFTVIVAFPTQIFYIPCKLLNIVCSWSCFGFKYLFDDQNTQSLSTTELYILERLIDTRLNTSHYYELTNTMYIIWFLNVSPAWKRYLNMLKLTSWRTKKKKNWQASIAARGNIKSSFRAYWIYWNEL